MAMLLGVLLPAVPAVELPGDVVVAPGAVLLGLLLLLPLLLALPVALDGDEPIRAFVSTNWPAVPARLVLAVEPAVPVVPVAPGVLVPPCRQPVTVTARLLLLEV